MRTIYDAQGNASYTVNDDLTDAHGSINGEKCYICGQIIKNGAGHFVALMTGDGNSEDEGEPLYITVPVCFVCDPPRQEGK